MLRSGKLPVTTLWVIVMVFELDYNTQRHGRSSFCPLVLDALSGESQLLWRALLSATMRMCPSNKALSDSICSQYFQNSSAPWFLTQETEAMLSC